MMAYSINSVVIRYLRVYVLCLLIALDLVGAQRTSVPAAGRIEGVVYDGITGEPLSDVQVTLEGGPIRTLTDNAGRFAFESLSPGLYVLRTFRPGYSTAKLRQQSIPDNNGIP